MTRRYNGIRHWSLESPMNEPLIFQRTNNISEQWMNSKLGQYIAQPSFLAKTAHPPSSTQHMQIFSTSTRRIPPPNTTLRTPTHTNSARCLLQKPPPPRPPPPQIPHRNTAWRTRNTSSANTTALKPSCAVAIQNERATKPLMSG